MTRAPHVLTIDLEDWFHCLEPDMGRWAAFERRARLATAGLLERLAAHRTFATFFVLGDVAEHDPALVREAAAAGHEIGTHGMKHRFVYHQTPADFAQELKTSIELLEDLCQKPVRSYRAPYFSITKDSLWAFEGLARGGIHHDSSVFPAHNPRYGIPQAPRTPHPIRPGLWEWPVSTLPTLIGNLPFCGGAYFRLLPFWFIRWAIRQLERREEPIVFYLHPWELDARQPQHRTGSAWLNFRHYHHLSQTASRLDWVLRQARYVPLAEAAQRYPPPRESRSSV